MNANEIGIAYRIKLFLNLLDIKLGSEEKEAMNQRHSLMHDIKKGDKNTIDKIRYYTNVYISLFNRIMLKMLEYDGNYMDYSDKNSQGQPIDIPAGDN